MMNLPLIAVIGAIAIASFEIWLVCLFIDRDGETGNIESKADRDARLSEVLVPARNELTAPVTVAVGPWGSWGTPVDPELAYVHANMPKVVTNGIYRPRHAAEPGEDTQAFEILVASTWSHADIEALEKWCTLCEDGHHPVCPGCACPCGTVQESGAQVVPIGHMGRDITGERAA